jgi:hypothetical protein
LHPSPRIFLGPRSFMLEWFSGTCFEGSNMSPLWSNDHQSIALPNTLCTWGLIPCLKVLGMTCCKIHSFTIPESGFTRNAITPPLQRASANLVSQ